eukprot:CAMPEP_0181195320 /NCGR_PEP_ID=MMETSP1096-20121128/14821_1 /TAXON_ID=156174 ORGANISM="Chrysochromulina ericina, Strain CCMP281" /NCGR_SAMPLE_ID=MMETSP1096 /ASSEMBLY_ACC=CAM_ASM_000453 /LENGTH=122 /DNA_ID=CAMNT_0023284909 /DNA_START=206 /DNA_END=574 /DNA_ORIENTATION=-
MPASDAGSTMCARRAGVWVLACGEGVLACECWRVGAGMRRVGVGMRVLGVGAGVWRVLACGFHCGVVSDRAGGRHEVASGSMGEGLGVSGSLHASPTSRSTSSDTSAREVALGCLGCLWLWI